MKLGWSVSSVLCEDFPKTIEKAAAEKWKGIADGNLVPLAETCNGVADVAIALEPVYWPWITSRFRGRSLTADDELDSIHDGYRDEALKFVRSIELERLKHAHELLRIRAAMLEDNTDLYRLIRSANWATRHNIKGETGLAMWIRHMAEVLRRGTEEAHDVQLEEEDVAFGMWHKSGRKLAFGSDRALDHPSYYRKELLQRMGLDVSVRVKWYVEGATEVGFLNAALGGIRDSQVEVVDCKGKFTGDALVELFEDLKRDKAAERFSFVSADADVSANIAAIKRMVSNDLIVGYIPIYNPDFEFANFTIEELVTAAIYYDKEDDYPTDSSNLLDVSLFAGVRNGHDFEQKYIEIHEGTRREVKGMAWGRALWETVKANLDLPGGGERPVIAAIRVAYMSADVEYRYQQEQFRIDSGTLGIVKRD
ncbi:MAG: hypothetical protein JSS65_06140 [Armatimonadetes bacterium]|nr:hypothetical protein [Armatimonadota bacterium]